MAGIAIGLDKYDEYGTDADGDICKNLWEWGQNNMDMRQMCVTLQISNAYTYI